MRRSFDAEFQLVLSETTLGELHRKVLDKPSLARRLSSDEVAEFVATLHVVAEIIPAGAEEYEPITRDPQDDYLLAPAIRARVDYVVSGDHDLQVLGAVAGVKILSPAEFLRLLDDGAEQPPQ